MEVKRKGRHLYVAPPGFPDYPVKISPFIAGDFRPLKELE